MHRHKCVLYQDHRSILTMNGSLSWRKVNGVMAHRRHTGSQAHSWCQDQGPATMDEADQSTIQHTNPARTPGIIGHTQYYGGTLLNVSLLHKIHTDFEAVVAVTCLASMGTCCVPCLISIWILSSTGLGPPSRSWFFVAKVFLAHKHSFANASLKAGFIKP